jgi:MoxR-like ATPase
VTDIKQVATVSNKIIAEVEKAIIGKRDLIRRVMTAILADGHVLLEDFPGLGKTLLANSFAIALGLEFKRIQFTPDLLPGDITGGYIFNRATSQFELRKGPLFANIVLADEINRASPKTQSALLEAMQEHQVTLEGETMRLPEPFIVMATQNPIEYEGTFPLPEAQLDRFMMKLSVGYPSAEEEQEILRRRMERQREDAALVAVTDSTEIQHLRSIVETVYIDPDIQKYIVSLVTATRKDSRVAVGASPRGSLALLKLARAWAALDGREYVLPDDIKSFARPALMHRMILEPDLWMKRNAARDVVNSITKSVPVPVIEGA